MAVAGNTVHLSTLDMGGMGKENAIGLPGVYQPWNFSFLGDILLYKFDLIRTYSLNLFMTIDALGKLRSPGEGTVFPKKMTAFASVIDFFDMKDMVKVNGLFFIGIKKFGENDPSHNKAGK